MLVRADSLPLVFPVIGAQGLPRGARVRVALGDIDEIALDVRGTVLERLDTEPADTAEEDEGEQEEVAGPIAIAVDVSEDDTSSDPKEPVAV